VHLGRPGKADGFARQTLDPRAQRQMLPLNLLRIPRAWVVLGGVEVPGVGAPITGVIAGDPTGLPQCFPRQEHLVFALLPLGSIKHIGVML
jgi:hypothetical protein